MSERPSPHADGDPFRESTESGMLTQVEHAGLVQDAVRKSTIRVALAATTLSLAIGGGAMGYAGYRSGYNDGVRAEEKSCKKLRRLDRQQAKLDTQAIIEGSVNAQSIEPPRAIYDNNQLFGTRLNIGNQIIEIIPCPETSIPQL